MTCASACANNFDNMTSGVPPIASITEAHTF